MLIQSIKRLSYFYQISRIVKNYLKKARINEGILFNFITLFKYFIRYIDMYVYLNKNYQLFINFQDLPSSLIYLIVFQDIHNILTVYNEAMKPKRQNSGEKCFFQDNQALIFSIQFEEKAEQRLENNQQSKRKTKPIKKNEKASNLRAEITTQRRNRYEQQENSDPNRPIGRPQSDQLQTQHLLKSRQYNDIIYHYSKFLIYFYIMKGKDDTSPYALTLQNHESLWMRQAADIMGMDNFPSTINLRHECFLLHANSLHFIFFHNKINKISKYESEQIKYYLFEFLRKRGLLTKIIHTYISQYWADIFILLNQWNIVQPKRQKSMRVKQLYIESNSSKEPQLQSRKDLKELLESDNSIAAYEIACYLKCCCDHFSLLVLPSQKS